MSDLISRTALINKAEYEAEAMQEPFKSLFPVLVAWLAEKMPSAESEIVRCGNCKWWGRKDTYKDGSSMIVCKKGRSTSQEGYCHHAERREDE